jgi:trafficking protein particle complex subunit 6
VLDDVTPTPINKLLLGQRACTVSRAATDSVPSLRFSIPRPRPTTPLDTIKFVCKDLWTLLFRKQIDNLKTNHRGVFVLTDNNFRPISKISLEKNRDAATMMAQAQPFLYFPAGVIRGALASLGLEGASVVAECGELPGVTFQIRTAGSRP